MTGMRLDRRNSRDVAAVSMGQGWGGRPTERWQDKSREVRGGRSVGEGAIMWHFARCASLRDSLSALASLWHYTDHHTSRVSTR
jgi:hypothetical protein